MNRELSLTTQRLTLRPLVPADTARLQVVAGVPEVAQMMSSVELPWEEAQVLDWITSSQWRGHLGFRLGICLQDGLLIGATGIGPRGDIAYFIGQAHWGQGYATEALQRFLQWLFLSFDMDQIEAEHLDDNPGSGKVLRKLGFVIAGQSTCKSKARVEAEPSTLYRLSKDAFEGQT